MKDLFEALKEFMPLWLVLITFAFGYLAYLYSRIFKKTNDLADKQSQYLKDRIDMVDKTTGIFERAVKQQEGDLTNLQAINEKLQEDIVKERQEKEFELGKLRTQLDLMLNSEGVTLQNLAFGQRLKSGGDDTQAIDELIKKMMEKIDSLETLLPLQASVISDSQLTLAKAQMAKGNLIDAADRFEEYTALSEASWEVYFSKAVNLANLRKDEHSNRASIKAYNDALNQLPSNINLNIKARIFSYRAAMLKRVNRLDEAESDLLLGKKLATATYEIDDINYNLACVYAMQGNKERMLDAISCIQHPASLKSIRHHMGDYFEKFRNDTDLANMLSLQNHKLQSRNKHNM